jgi:hypothetical protein
MSREECQAILSRIKRPLVVVETDTLNGREEIEKWLEE